MVSFAQLPGAVQSQVQRIIRGQSPNPGKASLNAAIDFINANPSIRRGVEGGLPTGLAPGRREAFLQQQQERIGLTAGQLRGVQEISGIPLRARAPGVTRLTRAELFEIRKQERIGAATPSTQQELARQRDIRQVGPTRETLLMRPPSQIDVTDVSTRKGNGFLVDTLGRAVDFIGGGADFKKGFEKEIFDPQSGFFVTAGVPGGTPSIRVPTLEEQAAIEKTERAGSLERIEEISKTFTTPEGVRSLSNLGAELTFEGGKVLSSVVEDALVGIDKALGLEGIGLTKKSKIFTTPSPISTPTAKSVISDIFLFSAFSPFINTATAARASTKAKAVQKEVKATSDKKKIEKLRKLREDLSTASETKVKSFVKKTIKDIKKLKLTPDERALRLKNLEIFVREARGQIAVSNGRITPLVRFAKGRAPTVAPTVPKAPTIEIEIPPLTKLGKLPGVLTGVVSPAKIRNDELIRQAKVKEQARVERAKLSIGEKLKPSKLVATRTVAALATNVQSLSDQLSLNKLKQKNITKQLTKTTQILKQKSLQKQLSNTKVAQQSLVDSISKLKTVQKNIAKQKLEIAKGRGLGGKPFFVRSKLKKKIPLAMRDKTRGWLPLIKEGGKFKRFSRPFKTKQSAIDYARWVVDNSTSAQYKIKPQIKVREFSKRLVPPTSGLKFRNFRLKRNVKVPLKDFGEIELKKHRISSKGEIAGLKAGKLLAQRFGKKKTPKIKSFATKIKLKAPNKIELNNA